MNYWVLVVLFGSGAGVLIYQHYKHKLNTYIMNKVEYEVREALKIHNRK